MTPVLSDDVATDLQRCDSPATAFDRLVQLYDEATGEIESAFADFARGEAKHGPDPVYPYLCVDVTFDDKLTTSRLAFGKVTSPGRYGTTITQPRLFHNYLIEQLTLICRRRRLQGRRAGGTLQQWRHVDVGRGRRRGIVLQLQSLLQVDQFRSLDAGDSAHRHRRRGRAATGGPSQACRRHRGGEAGGKTIAT